MRIKITQQSGAIGVKTTPAKLYIHSEPPKLKIKQRRAELIINREGSKLIIDKKEAWEQMGNKTLPKLIEDFAKRAKNICTEATIEMAKSGTKIAKAGKSRGEVIKQIILKRMTDDIKTINVDLIPKEGPRVRYIRSKLEITWVIHEPEIEWEINARVEIEVEPHRVEIYVRRKPFIKIEVVEDEDKSEFQQSKIVNRKI